LFGTLDPLFRDPALSVCVGNSLGRCAGDNNGNDSVTIAELIQGVNAALRGCATQPHGACVSVQSAATSELGAMR